jgi:hypothetical protein
MRIYLDAAPVIFVVEQVVPYAAKVLARLAAPGMVLVSSDLTRMEALIKPLRQADTALVQNFNSFFAAQISDLVHGLMNQPGPMDAACRLASAAPSADDRDRAYLGTGNSSLSPSLAAWGRPPGLPKPAGQAACPTF